MNHQGPGWNNGQMYAQASAPRPGPGGGSLALVVIGSLAGGLVLFVIAAAIGASGALGSAIVGGVALLVVGLAVLARKRRAARIIAGINAGSLVAGFALGLTIHLISVQSSASTCRDILGHAAGAKSDPAHPLSAKQLADLEQEVTAGVVPCGAAGMTDAVTSLQAAKGDIEHSLEDLRQFPAKQSASDQAAAKEAARQMAVADWPTTVPQIKSDLLKVSQEGSRSHYQAAIILLNTVDDRLSEVRNTPVDGTPDWLALQSQSAMLRARFGPPADKQAQAEDEKANAKAEAEAAKEARANAAASATAQQQQAVADGEDAVRGKKPELQDFHGCNYLCKTTVVAALNDPDSFECVGSSDPQIEGLYWTTVMQYRATNGLGGKVLDSKKCFIQDGAVVKVK